MKWILVILVQQHMCAAPILVTDVQCGQAAKAFRENGIYAVCMPPQRVQSLGYEICGSQGEPK